MEVYLARQPVFYRNMKVFGYELSYKRNPSSFLTGIDDQQTKADMVSDAFLAAKLDILTGSRKALINFTEDLLEQEVPLLLPRDTVIVEIADDVKPTSILVSKCKKIKKYGYPIALNGDIFQEEYISLFPLADIIKIDISSIPIDKQTMLIRGFQGKIKFLADKVDTWRDYEKAAHLGYHYFQGEFYCKPVLAKGEGKSGLNPNLIKVINELNQEEPDYQLISNIIEQDASLSNQVIRMANSPISRPQQEIYSTKQALIRLGLNEIRRWIYVLILDECRKNQINELITSSLVRARMMETIANDLGMRKRRFELFILGLFFSMEAIMQKPMKEILEEIPLSTEVKDALLGKENQLSRVLNWILAYEKGSFDELDRGGITLDKGKVMNLLIESLEWVNSI